LNSCRDLTSIRFAEQLVKLSTESEKTHGTVFNEANSRDVSVQFPYFRFNVQNGMEEIGLEESDNRVLITSLTRTYLESIDIPTKLEEFAKGILTVICFVISTVIERISICSVIRNVLSDVSLDVVPGPHIGSVWSVQYVCSYSHRIRIPWTLSQRPHNPRVTQVIKLDVSRCRELRQASHWIY
jgi:hypothetical protein